MRRWLRLIVYLAVGCLTLGLGLARLLPWGRVLLGPASLTDALVSPWPWLLLTLIASLGLIWLVGDLGLGLKRMPAWASGIFVLAAVAAILLMRGEQQRGPRAWSRISDAPPRVQASESLALLSGALADHFRERGRYPTEVEWLADRLREADGGPVMSAYLYGAARQRPVAIRMSRGEGPVVGVPPGTLPGTLLYTLSPGGEAFWLTAVVGDGIPTVPRVLASASGRPVVVSNVPAGWVAP